MKAPLTLPEKEVFEGFAFRHANLYPIDYVLGEAVYDRIREERLTYDDIIFLLHLGDEEEKEIRETPETEPLRPKLARLLANIAAARKILLSWLSQ